MLSELRVENLLLIERAELRLAPGLNVLTGETGAGKTVLAHALDLLLGGRARPGIVRPGAAEAYVEGVFELSDALRLLLGERLPPDAEELVVARRVSAEGRTRAYLGGRSATVADLRDVGSELIAFYGQHEHRKLMHASAQLEILDGFCGPEHLERRAALGDVFARARALDASLVELGERAGARDRELDLLEFELSEIEAADPDEAEEAALVVARERLRQVEALRAAALGAAEAVLSADGEAGAGMLLAAGGATLDGVAGGGAGVGGLGRGGGGGAGRGGGPPGGGGGAAPGRAAPTGAPGGAAGGRVRGRGPRGRAAPLRRGPRRRAGRAGVGRGAPRGGRAAEAQARRHDRGRARPRRGVPRPARRARRRGGGARGGDGGARGGTGRARHMRRGAARVAGGGGATASGRGARGPG